MVTFKLEIITPERIAYEDQVKMVVAPGVDGQMGILAHHAPLFAQLTEGELKVQKDNDEFFLALGGGYIEVTPTKVTVLVTKAVHADEINEAEMEKAKLAAEEALKQKPEGADLDAARSLLRSTLIDLKVARHHKLKYNKSH